MVTVVVIVVVVASTVLGVEVNLVTVETAVVKLRRYQHVCGTSYFPQRTYIVVVGVTVLITVDVRIFWESDTIFVVVIEGVGKLRHEQAVESVEEAKA